MNNNSSSKYSKFIIASTIFCMFSMIQAATTVFIKPEDITNKRGGMRITESGLYVFTDDVFFTQVNVTAITVVVDDVTIDLNGKTLRASNPSGEDIGINIIGPSRKNVTVRNGKIANFNVFSVRVDTGSTAITLENLGIISSNIRGATALTPTGIGFEGTPLSAVRTTDVVINNCTVNNSRFGLRARATDSVKVTNSTFNSNGSRGISAIDCNLWEVTNCQAANQKISDELGNFGLAAFGCSFWRVKNCDFSFNRIDSTEGVAIIPPVGGAQFQALIADDLVTFIRGSGSHIIEDCTFCNNEAAVGSVIGRGLALVLSNSCVIRNCIANGNSSINTQVTGYLEQGSGNLYENCIADGNFSQSAILTAGFGVGPASGSSFVNCSSKRNILTVGGGFGIGFLVDFQSSNCLVQNCLAVANEDFGFINASPTSVFIGNLAFANPTNYLMVPLPGFITVVNGVQPPAGTFDERQIDNISIV